MLAATTETMFAEPPWFWQRVVVDEGNQVCRSCTCAPVARSAQSDDWFDDIVDIPTRCHLTRLVIAGCVILTWKQFVDGFFLGLAGRRWLGLGLPTNSCRA